MHKVYFDTEFTGLHKNTTLISIGLISQCGKSFYAELTDYDKTQVDDWLSENVISNMKFNHLPGGGIVVDNSLDSYEIKANKKSVAQHLEKWLKQFGDVEMWSDCLSYDWVLFCDLWGHAFSVPKNVYYIPFDISTTLKENGIDPDINREEYAFGDTPKHAEKHNALWDAKVIKIIHEKLM
jgi:hypothetical protein